MIPILLIALAWPALLLWLILLLEPECDHPNLRGVANYFDHEHRVFVHQKYCPDCKATVVTFER